MKVLMFLLSLFWGIANLFLAFAIAVSVGKMWNLEPVASLKFIEYWGYTFVFAVFASPLIGSLTAQLKRDDDNKEIQGPVGSFITTTVLAFVWLMSLVMSTLFV